MRIAPKFGFTVEQLEPLVAEATKNAPEVFLLSSPHTRELTESEGQKLVRYIRSAGLVRRSVYDAQGERVEDLPFDAKMLRGYVSGDIVWLDLQSRADFLFVKYSFIARLSTSGPRIIFQHANDIGQLPFDPAFPEVVKLYTEAKGLYAWWNYYEAGQGQPGLWFRTQLQKACPFQAWSPDEQVKVLEELTDKGPLFTGLVYARTKARAIAQFYNNDGNLRFAEFLDGSLLRTRSLEEATTHLESTNSSEVWWSYNGVCQQFGHPDMIRALYKTRAKGSTE